MKYEDYVNLDYKPKKTDLICDFRVEPLGIPFKRAAGGIAAESSIGTWTELTTVQPYMEKLAATVFEKKGQNIKIAYPIELFEGNNMPNILSSIAGNVFGLAELKNLRLNDIQFPEKLVQSFPGPKYGIHGIRKLLGIERPLIGTIVKPKLGLNSRDHSKVAFEAWMGGCDAVKDDENLSSQAFNKFYQRMDFTLNAKDKAETETGEKKVYFANITAETDEMIRRAEYIEEQGGKYVMIDVLTAGWSAVQTLREHNFDLIIHAHRAGHAAFTKNPKHGVSMKTICRVARLCGVDQIHVGTAGIGKMCESKTEVLDNIEVCKDRTMKIKQVLPVASGGLNPRSVPGLVKIFGKDVAIQAGGGIHGNPLGTRAGATAMRQALDATLENKSLPGYAKGKPELTAALKKWKR